MILDIYVDGSYFKKTPNITFGGIIIVDNKKKNNVILIRRVETEYQNFVTMNNAGGEIVAALVGLIDACQICNGEKSTLNIYYDYTGVKSFLTGEYNAKKDGNLQYIHAVRSVLSKNPNIELKFHKIKAHSGNKFNDLADTVAKGNNPNLYLDKKRNTIKI